MMANEADQGWWTLRQGPGPLVATAIHDGHGLRPEVAEAMVLSESDRLREEDPFTGEVVRDIANHVVVHRSRFEIDLNRSAEAAIYRTPEQSWGLTVWKPGGLGEALAERTLALHREYYRMLRALLDGVAASHDRFVLLDVHCYNHRRDGPMGPPTPQREAPDVNIGTSSMPRDQWAFLVDPLIERMREMEVNGRRLDVRENVSFQGKGEQTRFVHEHYPGRGCAIAIEFKKFFMDEWTGIPDPAEVAAIRRFIAASAQAAAELIER